MDKKSDLRLEDSCQIDELSKGRDKRKLGEDDNRHCTTSKKQKKKLKGMNKNRGPTYRMDRDNQLCPQLVDRRMGSDPGCNLPGCRYTHDLQQFLTKKLLSLGDQCYIFITRGHCPRGLTCRFSTNHINEEGFNIVNQRLYECWKSDKTRHTFNGIDHKVQVQLRKRTYNFDKANKVLSQLNHQTPKAKETHNQKVKQEDLNTEVSESNHVKQEVSESNHVKQEFELNTVTKGVETNMESADISIPKNGESRLSNDNDVHKAVGPVFDNTRLRKEEIKKIDWKDKLYLSPLTTVGNLPFRRICKELGADVTCGEMALAVNLLQGKPQEWALTKRHGCEDLFGIQVCGNSAHVMTKCAQLVTDQADVDFIDINVGCPIDLIYQQGAGSGLLNKKKVLFSIVKCMSSVLDIPLTVKTRMGVYSGKNVAHTYMKDLSNSGADLITIHGRSKEQRYTKLADWEYVEQCAQLASPTPVIGNGDILSYEDYVAAKARSPSSVSVMIGRGALIKPWVFTEIKEQRNWDISSQERYEMLQRYTNYGLEHWGSDTKGVESTRRFLLEWLSFLYRYIPVGLMESPPQKMNERPPKFEGRNDLEVLMASSNCADWINISEMLLGPVPDGFHFLPKHKANSWT